MERDEHGNWKDDPGIDVSHAEPLTDEQIEAFRELGRVVLAFTTTQGGEAMKARDWDELERLAGIQRTVPKAVTQRDVEVLTARRLARAGKWRRKLRPNNKA